MRLLSRTIFREIVASSMLGAVLFTFILFLRSSQRLFEFLVRNSGTPSTVAYLFALVLPQALPFTIPLGVLVGTLVTLSRMSTDGEITAMRAAGVPGRRVAPPIFTFGFLAMLIGFASSLWLTPWSIREFYRIENLMIARQLTADIQPRVFEEQFPNTILYVSDITSGTTARLRRIFMADITPPGDRKPGAADRGDSPRVTLASEATALPDVAHNRIQLQLRNGTSYESDKDNNYHVSGAPVGDQVLEAQKREEQRNAHPSNELDTIPLYRAAYKDPSRDKEQRLEDRIELHRRFALPIACILLAISGVPLGITRRRAGKSAAVVLTVVLAFIYYMGLISCVSMARQGTLRPEIAMWIPNLFFAIFGIAMIVRLEAPGDHDLTGAVAAFFRSLVQSVSRAPQRGARALDRLQPRGFALLPQVIDTYVLTSFLFYFVLLVISFVLIFHVFEFFSLLSDILKNHPAMSRVLSYHFFLTPRLIYEFTPIAVLAAVLVAFGVLSKHNEITAFKACGISVYRLTVPVLVAGFFLSGSLFAFDHYWVPEADRRQDALRAEIKGKRPQTYLRPDRQWIYGKNEDRVFYDKYFDPAEHSMFDVNVYEIDGAHFRLKRHIWATRARWDTSLGAWVFQNGWSRDMDPACPACPPVRYENFAGGIHMFPELEETPDYFVHEVKQSFQMNFQELEGYIGELQRSGFDTIPLQVQLNKKFSVPLFALIMAMVSLPFAFIAGNRGAMAGVGLSLGIAIAYWSIGQVFEQVGNLNQLPPGVAAWAPDVIFSLAGLYFLARMRT
jgi:LPS export ABC transporter permease LptF/LPS export ABC transporter permease LptG